LPGIGQVISAANRAVLPEAEIRCEISAQIDAFITHFGRPPDFIDGHQHVHILKAIRPWLFDALEGRGLKGKVWIRDAGDRLTALLARASEIKKALAVSWLSRGFAQAAATRGFQTNQGFSGFSSFDATQDYAASFARYLIAPGRRHLVMCHPGFVDEELIGLDPVTVSRPKELEFLMSSRLKPASTLKAPASRGLLRSELKDRGRNVVLTRLIHDPSDFECCLLFLPCFVPDKPQRRSKTASGHRVYR
jgi:predicted glycoside hydrolase/deacetylase ChbG (UPF0249 family)